MSTVGYKELQQSALEKNPWNEKAIFCNSSRLQQRSIQLRTHMSVLLSAKKDTPPRYLSLRIEERFVEKKAQNNGNSRAALAYFLQA